MKEKRTFIGFAVDEETWERLDEMAQRYGYKSRHLLCRSLVLQALGATPEQQGLEQLLALRENCTENFRIALTKMLASMPIDEFIKNAPPPYRGMAAAQEE